MDSKTRCCAVPSCLSHSDGEPYDVCAGRGLEYYDGPPIRKIVSDAGQNDYRFSSLILGIVKSVPFQMRRAEKCRPQSQCGK